MVKAATTSPGKQSVGRRPAASSPEATQADAPAFAKWVRGADADWRASILDTADEIFLEAGFQAASMSEIAARLGGSKGTLYNYFSSKEDLFIACVKRHCENFRAQMSALIEAGGDLESTLTRVGRRYVEFVGSDDTVRKFRMIVAEAERVPSAAAFASFKVKSRLFEPTSEEKQPIVSVPISLPPITRPIFHNH